MSTRIFAPQIDVDDVVNCIKQGVRIARNEEVRVRVSRCIEDKILKPLGITQYGHHEYMIAPEPKHSYYVLCDREIIEYQASDKLSSIVNITWLRIDNGNTMCSYVY